MKKIIYLFIVLTVFLIGPLSFRADTIVGKYSDSTQDQLYHLGDDYDYDFRWHITITKTVSPEQFSGKFVATEYYRRSSPVGETYVIPITISDISKECLDDLSCFVSTATIETELNATNKLSTCIDRILHPEYFENIPVTAGIPQCKLLKISDSKSPISFKINSNSINIITNEGETITCSDFNLDNGENLIEMLFTIIKIIAPVLVIVFGSLDFVKAIFQADEEKQKKAGQDFIKRLIAAALIFLIPTILEIILGVAFNWDEAIPKICVK